ncbi:probable DNA polymerase III epsilon chain [Lachnospiraceae bacterium KM106-2]|nr:probable DNA polymerase III epsilon chain [Lachnospiraceae bacterium KM106-2]
MNFIAIDFETANEKRSSPCSIGITVVKDGTIIEEKTFLIRPHEMRFEPINIMIHGIRPDDVKDCPEFCDLWDELFPYFNNNLIVAHNASFDMSVLRATLDLYNITYPTFSYTCSMLASKHFYPMLPNAKLDTVNQFLSYDFLHHDAGADASACANILLTIMKECNVTTTEDYVAATGLSFGSIFEHGYKAPKYNNRSLISKRNYENTAAKPCPVVSLTGKVVCFTGPLKSMSRSEAASYVMQMGGCFSSSVTKKTNLLVTNVSHPETLSPSQMSTKLRRAMDLKSKGQEIAIINEEEFFHLGI